MIPFSLLPVPDCTVYVLFLASVHRGIPPDINILLYYFYYLLLLLLLFTHFITHILYQGSINYLLIITMRKKLNYALYF